MCPFFSVGIADVKNYIQYFQHSEFTFVITSGTKYNDNICGRCAEANYVAVNAEVAVFAVAHLLFLLFLEIKSDVMVDKTGRQC